MAFAPAKRVIWGMMKRLFLMAVAALALALPARAETPSRDCLAAIKAAVQRHRADRVPDDCWRMGPLKLGMSEMQARTLLGQPDASRVFTANYRRRKYALDQLLYVYPRNLKNWLRLGPARQQDFHPVTLRLAFYKEALVALTVRNDVRIAAPACVPKTAGRYFERKGVDFPYGFHGLTLGAAMDSVQPRFGRFAGQTNTYFYWPVPLAVGGAAKVVSIDIATGMAFVNRGAPPDFQLHLDPKSCFITGYAVQAAPGLPGR